MARRVIVLSLLATVLVVGGAGAVLLRTRPDLEDRRSAVDARWAALRGPLVTRYDGLARLSDALGAAGAGERTYAVALAEEVGTWVALADRDEPDPGAEAASANRLEGLANRIRVNVAGSARLSRDAAVVDALSAYDAALVPDPEVGAYNRSARRYHTTRTDTVSRLPADLLGFEARPALVLGSAPPGA
jgi:hypothetical protein